MSDELILTDAEREAIEKSRAAKEADSTQPACDCNAATLPHFHASDGIKLA